MQTGSYLDPQSAGRLADFGAMAAAPQFGVVTIIHVLIRPDDVAAGAVPALDYLAATLPAGQPYDLFLSMPLSTLGDGPYPFATRPMMIGFDGHPPAAMNVPILSLDNGKLVSNWVCGLFMTLPGIVAAARPNFRLRAFSSNLTSLAAFDATQGLGNDVTETSPEQGVAGWAGYQVSEESVRTVLANHGQALGAAAPGLWFPVSQMNPLLTQVGHLPDGGKSYSIGAAARIDGIRAGGGIAPVFDPSLGNGLERSVIEAAAEYAGAFACQLLGSDDPVRDANEALSRNALWMEVEAKDLPVLQAAGWDGGAFSGASLDGAFGGGGSAPPSLSPSP